MKLITPWSAQLVKGATLVRGEGTTLWDGEGRAYFDLCSQLMAVNLGHGDRRISEAMASQAGSLAYVNPSYTMPIREKLVEKLAEIAPAGLDRVFLTTSGADAIENAIKLARLATGRHKVVTKYRSYHGATAAAISASGDPRRISQAAFETPGIVRVEDPYCYRCPWGQTFGACRYECVSHLERVIEFEGPETIAAIILEGESGTSGCIKYPPDYWRRAREISSRYGIVLISDEVMSGFRCGDWFAVSRQGVVPDMIVMAKGLTSGYIPMGGILTKESLISPRFDRQMLPIGLTYAAHPVGCAAAVAAISIYQEENLIHRPLEWEAWLRQTLVDRLASIPCVGDIRVTGFLGVIELVKPGSKSPLVEWNGTDISWSNRVASLLWDAGLAPNVRWNYVFFAPPLIASQRELGTVIDQLGSVLDRVSTEINDSISENT